MVAITNHSTLIAINSANNARTGSTDAISRLATGKVPDFGQRSAVDAQTRSFEQGAKNLVIHAGRYEQFAGTANAIVALTQQKLELAVRYSQPGRSLSEYASAGALYVTLDAHISQLIATPPIGSGNFNAAKTEAFAAGRAVVTGPATRAWQRAADSTTVTGIAAQVTDINDVNSAAEFGGLVAALYAEVDTTAASANALAGIALTANVASLAAAEEAIGLTAVSDALSANFASETAKLSAHKIINEAATAMVSQSNLIDQGILRLLN